MRLLLALFLAAAPAAYHDPLDRYDVAFPAGWAVAPDPSNWTMTTATHPAGGATLQLHATAFAPGVGFEQYVGNGIRAWRGIWAVTRDEPARLGSLAGRRLILERRVGAAVDLQVKWLAPDGTHVYVLTGSAPLPAFPRVRDAFDAAAASFLPGTWAAADAPAPAASYTAGPVALAMPAGWRLVSRLADQQLIWHNGGMAATLQLREEGTPREALDQEKRTFADEARWRVLTEGETRLGGAPGQLLVSLMQAGDDGEWEAIHAVRRGDRLALLRLTVDRLAPTNAQQEALDAVLAGFRWK